jgi:hypothetical protein
MKTTVCLLAALYIGVCLLVSLPAIHKWERDNGYPYGRMCDPNIVNFYTSTCK